MSFRTSDWGFNIYRICILISSHVSKTMLIIIEPINDPCFFHNFGRISAACILLFKILCSNQFVIVRRAGLLWSQQDFEWRWSVPLFKCLTVLEFSFILFDWCLLITFFNFLMNYVPIVAFWIFTYHKIWILSIMFCSIWSYWIIYFLACLEVSWRVVS